MSTVDASLRYLSPLEGTGLAITVVSIVCGAISLMVVALRAYVRLGERTLGWDDGLMMSGVTLFVVEVVLACLGARAGLGAPDARLNDWMQIESKMYLMIWMMLYVISLVLIKSSICMTMLRIGSPIKVLRVCVYVLLGLSVATFVATFVGILCLCRPVEANWNTALVLEGKATCSTMDAMIGLSYFSTASSIATDLACAVLPGLIVWNMQLPKKTKISVCVLLSFGSMACISTMIRTPYIRYYRNPTDNLVYHVGNIVLWSNIETAIGLIAGSIPSLRRFISQNSGKTDIAKSNSSPSPSFGLATFGSAPTGGGGRRSRNRGFKNPTDLGTTVASVRTRGDGDWRRLQDDSYNKEDDLKSLHGIRADYTYEVELTQVEYEDQSMRGSSRDSIVKRHAV